MTVDPVGGVWTYCMELIRALESFGFEFVLASMGGAISPAQRREAGSLSNAFLHEQSYRLEWMDDPWEEVDSAGDWLLDLAGRTQPDCIHLNGYSLAALPWNAPVLVVAHSCVCSWWRAVYKEDPPRRYDTYRRRVQAGLSAADLLVSPTAAMLGALGETWDLARVSDCVIWNGRDPDRFAAREKEIGIFTAGRIWDRAKNISLLDEIAPAVDAEIIVAGDSRAPSGEIRRPDHLRAVGCLGGEEMAAYLGRTLIYASPARYEPFGLSVLEAALSGCALVLSDLASFRELWGDAAFYVPPDDKERWKNTLNTLAADRLRSEAMGAKARARALRYTSSRMAHGYRRGYAWAKSRFDSDPQPRHRSPNHEFFFCSATERLP